MYSIKSAYGRKYARSDAGQKLRRSGGGAAYSTDGAGLDIGNCRPSLPTRLLLCTLRSAGGIREDAKTTYHMLTLYVAHYGDWGSFTDAYYDYAPRGAKDFRKHNIWTRPMPTGRRTCPPCYTDGSKAIGDVSLLSREPPPSWASLRTQGDTVIRAYLCDNQLRRGRINGPHYGNC